ncbi:MAG: DNA topoisomerase, partial [Candidatus Woesearchaeota archaeon]
ELSKQKNYAAAASELLKSKKLSPCEGIKTDPAHPAIYPTGIAPKGLEPRHQKIYDLIVKRFLATFGKPAKRQTILLKLDVKGEQFVARGTRTVDEGWYPLYAPYIKLEETDLPAFNIGDSVKIKKTTLHAKQTAPPKRYNPSSLVRELERRGLGTKATRSEIVETLYKRNYIKGEQIRATELGMHAIEILERYCPKIIDEQMTRHFEQDMDSISRGIKKKEEVLEEARTFLVGLLEEFRSKERKIGEGLLEHFMETEAGLLNVGMCPVCKKGSLTIRKGKYGRFIACDRYPDCRTTFKLPPTGMVEVSKEVCGVCGYPMIKIIKKGKKPAELCINLDCPSKAAVGKFAEGHSCPSCKVGKLVIRKSIYGSFIACTNYPKCRYVQRGQK